MPRWLKITLSILLLLALAAGGAYYWYIADGAPPDRLPAYALDLDAIRTAAEELPGEKASDIRVEQVATFSFPAVAAVAGDGWNSLPLAAFSFQLVLPADSIIIDTALGHDIAGSLAATIDDAAHERMNDALVDASLIVATHEHADHIGGILGYPEPGQLARALRLNPQQIESLPLYGLVLPPALSESTGFDYPGIVALAPGVVLIRAPGHTPGSQMIYVRREDGRELLFIGDIAWTDRNLETGRGRPRLMSEFLLKENRDAVFAQLAALRTLRQSHPDLLIIPGHDPAAIAPLITSGALSPEFVPIAY